MNQHIEIDRIVNPVLSSRRSKRASVRRKPAALLLESLEARRVLAYSAGFTGFNTVLWSGSDNVDALEFSIVGGLYAHNQVGGGFVDAFDFDSTVPGVQLLPAGPGTRNDIVSVGTGNGITIDQSAVATSLTVNFYTLFGTGYVSTSLGDFTYTNANDQVNYLGGSGGNEIYFNNNLSSTRFEIFAGEGSDLVKIDGNSGTSSTIESIALFAQGGDDTVIISGITRPVYVRGGEGNDIIDGSGVTLASLTLYGDAGDDQIAGGEGNDFLYGNDGADRLYGNGGEDYLDGGLGLDSLFGGADADVLVPGKNNTPFPEILDGGSGTDTVRFELNALQGLIYQSGGKISVLEFGGVGPAVGFNSVDAENFLVDMRTLAPGAMGYVLTVHDLTGSQAKTMNVAFIEPDDENTLVLQGTFGDDTIDAATLTPPGSEPLTFVKMPWGTVSAFTSAAPEPVNTLLIQGMAGDDVIKVQDSVSQGAFAFKVVLEGGDGNDDLSADATILGGAGDDTLQGGLGNDSLDGGVGNDVYLLSAGSDIIFDSGNLSDADIIRVDGTIGADDITISQTLNAFDATVVVEFRDFLGTVFFTSTNSVTFVPVVEVHTYNNSDDLRIRTALAAGGNPFNGLGVRAFMGQGDDIIDATGVASDAAIQISGFGEIGNDTFLAGSGFNNYSGGDGSDTYVMNPTDNGAVSVFEGGIGNNTLVVNGTNIDVFAQTDGTLTANLSAGVFGWVYGNDVTAVEANAIGTSNRIRFFDISSTTVKNVTVVGTVDIDQVFFEAARSDDQLIVAMADPAITPGVLEVSGLPYAAYVANVTDANDQIEVSGNYGDDTFEAYATNGPVLIFHGSFGDDRYLINPTSVAATFSGETGHDTVVVNGSANGDLITVAEQATGIYSILLNQMSSADGIEAIVINGNAGDDQIGLLTLATAQAQAIELTVDGGLGNDLITTSNVHNGYLAVMGGAGDDEISGPSFALSAALYGNSGNDRINGGSASELIDGGEGADVLRGGEGDDSVYGGAGDDLIEGGLGSDYLSGGDGADLFVWTALDGSDQVDGGAGQDAMQFVGSPVADNEFSISSTPGPAAPGIFGFGLSNLALTTLTGFGSVLSTDLEHVAMVGGSACDKFNVGNLQQTTVTLVDLIFGASPTDGNFAVVDGTDTDDTIVVSSPQTGQVNVNGLPALVRLFDTNEATDTLKLRTGAGNDHVSITPAAADQIFAIVELGDGDDYIQGFSFAYGGAGNDTLIGTDGPDTLVGGLGDDSIKGLAGDDLLIGDSGISGDVADDAHSCGGDFSVIVIIPSPTGGNDTIHGGAGNDSVYGNQGDDYLFGDAGFDAVLGEEGDDYIAGGADEDQLFGGIGDDTIYGEAGNDSIRGEEGDDELYGNDGDDEILGGEGHDSISGGAGEDVLRGEAGDDTIYGDAGLDLIFGDLGDDSIYGGEGDDEILGGEGLDTIYGDAGNDILWGEAGDDAIFGGEGADAINGGEGDDLLEGGAGNDQIQGMAGDDFILGGDGHDLLVGGEGDDVIQGEAGNDVLWGEAGNDTLWGGNGNDMIYGGADDDFMLGGTPATANVIHKPRKKGQPSDGNDTMLGGDGFDHVDGGNGDNMLDAGADNISETLLAGPGNDIAYTHQATDVNYDRTALDGGFQHIYKQGELSEPTPPPVAFGLVSYTVPAFFFTGHIFYSDGTVVEHPPLSELMKKGRLPGAVPAAKPKKPTPARPTPNRSAVNRIPAVRPAASLKLRNGKV
jgi:Ca2+-binding RTX toxin-like protein